MENGKACFLIPLLRCAELTFAGADLSEQKLEESRNLDGIAVPLTTQTLRDSYEAERIA